MDELGGRRRRKLGLERLVPGEERGDPPQGGVVVAAEHSEQPGGRRENARRVGVVGGDGSLWSGAHGPILIAVQNGGCARRGGEEPRRRGERGNGERLRQLLAGAAK